MDRILVEGYPRSGNTFCNNILTASFPQAYVSSFNHSAAALSENHFVLIREPNAAISSFMSVFQEDNKNSAEQWWLRFYNKALEATKPERWIFFDNLVSNTEEVICNIGKHINQKPVQVNYSLISKNPNNKPYQVYSFDKATEFYLNVKKELNNH